MIPRRATLAIGATVTAAMVAGCAAPASDPQPQTHECVVTPNDLVECSEISGAGPVGGKAEWKALGDLSPA